MSARLDTLARQLVDLRTAKDDTERAAKKAKSEYKAVEAEFWENMEDQGLTTFTADLGEGYGKVQFQKRETIRGIVRDKARAITALTEMNLEDALLGTPEIPQGALSEHVRDWLASGQEIPDGIDFNPTRYVSQTRK